MKNDLENYIIYISYKMSDWNKDMYNSMIKLFAMKKQIDHNENAMNIILLTCSDMYSKHGIGFINLLLMRTGLQDEVEFVE